MSLGTIKAWSCAAIVAASLLLASCQMATPASRIAEHPALYDALPEKDKALVQQGNIRAGMSQEAVFLAWGPPNSQPYIGEKDGKRVERWVYTRLEPVMVTPAMGAPCWGAPACWHDGDTAYIPRNVAHAIFENGQLTAWEALR